jgi:predicted AlkP superfamily pyrophosphatase or phosphodiesterase
VIGRRALLIFLCALASAGLAPGCDAAPVARPILILVSLDGWRADYTDRADAPNIRALAARGVRSQALIVAFPTKTFPNHYTTVTGLYPEHHGIVGNTMVDPAIEGRFTLSSPVAKDPRWWQGEPLWTTVQRQGQRAASMFWPGSEVPGPGQPRDWVPYEDDLPNEVRVQQVLDWLGRPEAERPSFITLYFSDVDSVGHDYGPDSAEVMAAAAGLDRRVGDLVAGIAKLGLEDRVVILLTSDHGMSASSADRAIYLDDYLDLPAVDVIEWGPYASIAPKPGIDEASVLRALTGRHPAMQVWRKSEIPEALHYRGHPRIPPILALADDGWYITTRGRTPPPGSHGYDPRVPSMQALLIAAGPTIRRGVVVPPIESVHLYEFMCRVLGVTPAKNDGDRRATSDWFGR